MLLCVPIRLQIARHSLQITRHSSTQRTWPNHVGSLCHILPQNYLSLRTLNHIFAKTVCASQERTRKASVDAVAGLKLLKFGVNEFKPSPLSIYIISTASAVLIEEVLSVIQSNPSSPSVQLMPACKCIHALCQFASLLCCLIIWSF